MANGFVMGVEFNDRQVQVMPVAGGWPSVRDDLHSEYIRTLREFDGAHVVLLVDFDAIETRVPDMLRDVPEELLDRVVVIGAKTDPEELRRSLRLSFEEIGLRLAEECRDGVVELWGHELLINNAAEIDRAGSAIRAVMFTR
jgi:hypothetical protein